MQPLTFSSNKHFIPVGGKPLIYYPIETLASAGVKDFAITYNPGYLDMVQSFLGDGKLFRSQHEGYAFATLFDEVFCNCSCTSLIVGVDLRERQIL